jgi:hypothetical protein
MKAYISSRKSPTVKDLQKKRIIPSPKDRKDAEISLSLLVLRVVYLYEDCSE